jgi:N-methylhydantoinase B/oxoprolinase/acetone carboxylase alpha subunit
MPEKPDPNYLEPISAPEVEIDPVNLEIQWRRLITVMDETDKTVVRTAFSTIVGESGDFACVLCDDRGWGLAQSTFSTTLFTVTTPRTVRFMLQHIPIETLVEGDVLVCNDPWHGAGHLPDTCIATPVFHKGRIIGFICTVAHLPDIGGYGGYFNAREVFEEGLQIPPMRLYKAGEPNHLLFEIIAKNVRTPDLVIGDIRGIVAAETVGKRRLAELLDDYQLSDLRTLADNIHWRSELAMREAIRAIPFGEYRYVMDADGYDKPVHIEVRVVVEDGTMVIDLAGSSPQVEVGAINCTMNATSGDVLIAMKSTLVPHVPNNEGQFRPITVTAPEGCIFNCKYPAAVQARSVAVVHLHDAIYGALAQAKQDLVHGGAGTFWSVKLLGVDANGLSYNSSLIPDGGLGASARKDGMNTIRFPGNGSMAPTEFVENKAPVLVEEKEFWTDSAGPGCFRGGLGQKMTITAQSETSVTVTLRPNNVRFAPPGMAGGRDGVLGEYSLNGGEMPLRPLALKRGERVALKLPGGGGYGDPYTRDPACVAHDVRQGYVSLEAAMRDYRVVLHANTLEVDEVATAQLRQAGRAT